MMISFGIAEMEFLVKFKNRYPTTYHRRNFCPKLFMKRYMRTTLVNVEGNNAVCVCVCMCPNGTKVCFNDYIVK